MANKVFVLDTDRRPLDPVHSGYARRLLKLGQAAVIRRYPFTIILKRRVETAPSPLRLKCDPGSRQTGMACVNDATGEVVFAAEIEHRGRFVKQRLDSRRACRRSRRQRKTRYRKPRFLNRTRPKGWLPPSLESRVENILTWTRRFMRLCPIQALSQELVKFDMQKMEHPEIAGVQYQQGTLAGYELREYLLEKWKRKCAYCGSTKVPLQVEHIVPRANGGTDQASNLTLSCEPCNTAKGKLPVEVFLKNRPNVLKKDPGPGQGPAEGCSGHQCHPLETVWPAKGTGFTARGRQRGLDQVQSGTTEPAKATLARCCLRGEKHPGEFAPGRHRAVADQGDGPRPAADVLHGPVRFSPNVSQTATGRSSE